MPTGVGGEIQLVDAINIQAKKGLVESCLLDGERLIVALLMDTLMQL